MTAPKIGPLSGQVAELAILRGVGLVYADDANDLLTALIALKRVAENALGSEMHSGDRKVLMSADAAIKRATK
jgi:hypothetical protein